MSEPLLLADIGGTNARFALARDGKIGPVVIEAVSKHADPFLAFEKALAELTLGGLRPRQAAVAVAGPVEAGRAALTNGIWCFEAAALRAALGLTELRLMNDFEAIAWSLSALQTTDLRAIGGGAAKPGEPMVVLGPGTGLGVAAVVPAGERTVVLATQGGHVTMACADARESRVLEYLRGRFGHISAERVLSGAGLVVLTQAIAAIDGVGPAPGTPAQVLDAAQSGTSPLCEEAFDCFCNMLGTVAGNLALSLDAHGGVYLAGGILPRVADAFASSGFRARFEAKGRFSSYVAAIPTWLIEHPQPGLLGLMRFLDQGDR